MNVSVVAFFNNKGGVGKTSLVYHLAWMFRLMGHRVLAVDLDPQANLTSMFADDDSIERLWDDAAGRNTIYGFIDPLLRGVGDVVEHPTTQEVDDGLYLIPGDLALARFEDELSQQWPLCLDGRERAFRVTTAFWRVVQRAGNAQLVDVILLDLGPNLGAINRAALVSSDYLVVPLAADLFSLQGLRNLGPTVWEWREGWQKRLRESRLAEFALPSGGIEAVGYVVMQHAVRLDRPVKAYERWARRIPGVYAEQIRREPADENLTIAADPNSLGLIKHYRSLMPLAQEARKPVFSLRPADGAIGAHGRAVTDSYYDFYGLAAEIRSRTFGRTRAPAGDLSAPSDAR